MSHVKSNIQFPYKPHGMTADDIPKLTKADFDALTLSQQIFVYNTDIDAYNRLTGHSTDVTTSSTAPQDTTPQGKTPEQAFADDFERIVDDAFERVLGHKCGEIA